VSFISDTGDAGRLIKYLADSIPQGPHPEPHSERVSVRLDVLQAAIDHVEWLEKGNEEWRSAGLSARKQAEAARATARVAIGHLQAILRPPATAAEQQRADTAARDWLASIGAE
jgi:hypothetical protein